MSKHPLSRETEWFFSQHGVQVRAPIYRNVDRRKKNTPSNLRSKKITISGNSSCREGIIAQIRSSIRSATGTLRHPESGWRVQYVPYGSVDLDQSVLKRPGESFVAVHSKHITACRLRPNPNYKTAAEQQEIRRKHDRCYYSPYHHCWDEKMIRGRTDAPLTNAAIQDFLDVCDAVVGPLTVLLNPDRYQGNWWFTGVEDACENRQKKSGLLRWYGVDNTCIAHPALTSLYAGLVRQCAYIARTNTVDQVREDVEGMGLEECLNESDEVQALRIARKMQRWISVPVLKGGGTSNIPVGCGTFPKIVALHKSIYHHGFEATFNASFLEGWGVAAASSSKYSGIHTFMGRKGENTNGKRIKRLSRKKAA
ncbi:hypothetical protein LCGC14_0693320 [marine sediment metagenome]|uniref:Uncharacterized protein n=1 Tax=marine sediment metagenome TaxID=412755 RepID=A0A0F9TSS4_9ZZZZ